jgi:hypothetical protein
MLARHGVPSGMGLMITPLDPSPGQVRRQQSPTLSLFYSDFRLTEFNSVYEMRMPTTLRTEGAIGNPFASKASGVAAGAWVSQDLALSSNEPRVAAQAPVADDDSEDDPISSDEENPPEEAPVKSSREESHKPARQARRPALGTPALQPLRTEDVASFHHYISLPTLQTVLLRQTNAAKPEREAADEAVAALAGAHEVPATWAAGAAGRAVLPPMGADNEAPVQDDERQADATSHVVSLDPAEGSPRWKPSWRFRSASVSQLPGRAAVPRASLAVRSNAARVSPRASPRSVRRAARAMKAEADPSRTPALGPFSTAGDAALAAAHRGWVPVGQPQSPGTCTAVDEMLYEMVCQTAATGRAWRPADELCYAAYAAIAPLELS